MGTQRFGSVDDIPVIDCIPLTCRVCARRNIVSEATWYLKTKEVEYYTLCTRHASLIADYLVLDPSALPKGGRKEALQQLPRKDATT